MTQVQRIYSKQCRYCSSKENPVQIFWDDIHKQFTDKDGSRHQCANPSTKHRQEELDQKFNQTVNDLKAEISSRFSDRVQRIDSLQKSTARNASILTEIKAKLDGVLRNV